MRNILTCVFFTGIKNVNLAFKIHIIMFLSAD